MKFWILPLLAFLALPASATINVRDDAGEQVTLKKPAQRVISLAPHVTESLFAAGGGSRIVGTVSHSDYPPEASKIPRIGDNRQIDMERLLALKPDLIVIWQHKASSRQMDQLRSLGIPVYYSEPRTLDAVPETILRLGELLGTQAQAASSAAELRQRLDHLRQRYARQPVVRVFYQVWNQPLYTLNGEHIVSDAIRLCGGENVFARLTVPAPQVNLEAVFKEDPEAIVAGDNPEQAQRSIEPWRQYTTLQAVKRGNLFTVEADLLNRAGPRIIDGAAALCEKLQQARQNRRTQK